MRPVLEYGSSVWDPHTEGLQGELEKVQNRAARFVTRNYTFEEGSMTGILEQLKWDSLPDSLFSTAEMSDDCVFKFASLVRSRD